MPPRSYANRVSQFEDNFGLEAGRIEKLFSAQDATKTPAQQYCDGLMTLINEYAESCIKPTETSNSYHVRYDYIKEMIKGYEKLMQARHEQLNPGQPREKFDGARQQVVDEMQNMLKNTWDTSLVSSWAARVKDGTYDISELRKITQNAYKAGKGYFVGNLTQKNIDEKDELYMDYFVDDDFQKTSSPGETVFMMREVMQRVTESRSTRWYWNPRNWLQAIRESLYMRELNKQVKGPKGNLSPMNGDAENRGKAGWFHDEDRKDLYDMLKETAKELREEAERIEHRRQVEEAKKKAEEEAKKQAEEEAKKKAEEGVIEGDAADNGDIVAENQQDRPLIEPVVFKDEFKEPSADTAPPVKNTERLSKEHSMEP